MNYIVTTTIYSPSEAILQFAGREDWKLIVVGDMKTPHYLYENLAVDKGIIYLSPEKQVKMYPELSEAIGWNCIQRRNIGFLEAYRLGGRVVATVDDDNFPYDGWGTDILVGKDVWVDVYKSNYGVLDPMKLTNHPELWHRGYPLTQIKDSDKNLYYLGKEKRTVLIQVDLWDGDPDVDAVCRMLYQPKHIKLEIKAPFTSDDYMPFNSQNTFIHRSLLPYYMVLPHIGRADDIWGSYMLQKITNARPVFCEPSVYQARNMQLILQNFLDEVFSYTNTTGFLYVKGYALPEDTIKAWELYRNEYKKIDDKR